MYLNLNDRQDHSCPSGTQWYVCVTNDFTGCRSVDACNLPTCPNTVSNSSSVSASSSTLSSSQSSAMSSSPSSTLGSSISSTTPTSTPTSSNAGTVASTTSASPSETTTVVVNTPSAVPKGPIIAGVICGIVVLAIFTAMLWFFCRRRRQLDSLAGSSPLFVKRGSNGSEKFAMDHSPDEEAQGHSGGVFAPFGGYHKTPSVEARETSYRSLNSSMDTARIDPAVQSMDAEADAPIPDPEKSSLVAPPAHEHPAYHQLPGYAPNVPVYGQSQQPANPASRSTSTSEPAYSTLPSQSSNRPNSYANSGSAFVSLLSQSSNRPNSYAHSGSTYVSLPSQTLPEPMYDPKQRSRVSYRAELQSPELSAMKLDVLEESPELPALSFSPITLDTSNLTSPGTVFPYPSPTESHGLRFSLPTDMAPAMAARLPSPSQVGQSIEAFRPTPLTANEIAEIGTSMSHFRPTPLSAGEVAELSNSPTDFRPTHLSAAHSSPPQPTEAQHEATEYPFESPPQATSSSEQSDLTPFRTPSLSRARQLIRRHSSFKNATPDLPPHPPLPTLSAQPTLPSPTPPPLKFKKRSLERPEMPTVSTKYIPPRKPTSAKDLPFNYISLPSPQSPSSPSAIKQPTSGLDAIARSGSALTTYSIPIGLARSDKCQDTSDSGKTDQDVILTHNHSREWSDSDREHVMSWATYKGPDSPLMEGGEEFSPMVEQIATVQKMERVQNPNMLRRKSPQEELRQDNGVAGMEGEEAKEKSELQRSSRTSLKRTSPEPKPRRDSAKSTVTSPRSEVSPLFSPIQAGYTFSPLSPEERQWAGQK